MLKDKEPTEISYLIQAKIEGKIPFNATQSLPQQEMKESEDVNALSYEKIMYPSAKYPLCK